VPKKFVLNQDLESHKFLKLRNSVPNPVLTKAGTPWRGAREKSNVFFQILIEACSSNR
jgi:hypothetical protein